MTQISRLPGLLKFVYDWLILYVDERFSVLLFLKDLRIDSLPTRSMLAGIGSSFNRNFAKYLKGIFLAKYPNTNDKKPIAMQIKCYVTVNGVHFATSPPN